MSHAEYKAQRLYEEAKGRGRMTIDRATVERLLRLSDDPDATAEWGDIIALAEDWLRQQEALKEADRQLHVAKDALETIGDFPVDIQSGNSNLKSMLARQALSLIK
jgi:hypothetical protein